MHDDMQPDNMSQAPIGAHGESDREGAMAKADLYKLANYSLKLFKKLDDDAQLEGWVQAKITKAADYIASVFHYLEYEMEFSDYGARLDNNEMYNESQKLELKNKLMEAKAKVAELKKLQAEKVKEDRKEVTKTQHGIATATYGDDGKRKGVVHKDERKYSDEEHGEVASLAKGKSAAEKKADKAKEIKLPKPEKGTRVWGMKGGEKFEKTVKEGAKPDFADLDKDGDEKEPMKKAAKEAKKEKKVDEASEEKCNHTAKGKSCPVHGMKECSMKEDAKPSAGMTKKEKSSTVKAAKAGKDIGKPGKNFEKVAKKAGGGEKGEKIAAAAMWKNKAKSLKESLQALLPEAPLNEEDQAQAQAGLQALLDYAKQNDPQGLAQAVQQGGQAVENYFKDLANKIPANPQPTTQPGAGAPAAPTAGTEPKDMPAAGEVEAEEGAAMNFVNGVVSAAKHPGEFVQGAANQLGQEVGNAVNTVQGVVQGAQQVGKNVVQGVKDVANAATSGYNQARNPKGPNQPVMGQPTPDPKPSNAGGLRSATQADVRKEDDFQQKVATTAAQLRENAEFERLMQFKQRLVG